MVTADGVGYGNSAASRSSPEAPSPLQKLTIVLIHALARYGVSADGAIINHNSYTAIVTARIICESNPFCNRQGTSESLLLPTTPSWDALFSNLLPE